MFDKYLAYSKPGIQLLVFSALFFMSLMLSPALVDFLHTKIVGISTESLDAMKEIPDKYIVGLKILNSLALVFVLLLPAFLFSYLTHPSPLTYLKMNKGATIKHWLLALLLIIVSMPAVNLLESVSSMIPLNDTFKAMEEKYVQSATAMVKGNTLPEFLLTVISICFLPALIEEIFFRGCLQNVLLTSFRNSPFTAILISAIIFSIMHGQMSGLIPRIFLGLILGLAYYYSGSLWVSISIHFLNNFIAVFFMFLYNKHLVSFNIMKDSDTPIWIGIVSLAFTFALLYYFYKTRNEYQVETLAPIEEKNITTND